VLCRLNRKSDFRDLQGGQDVGLELDIPAGGSDHLEAAACVMRCDRPWMVRSRRGTRDASSLIVPSGSTARVRFSSLSSALSPRFRRR